MQGEVPHSEHLWFYTVLRTTTTLAICNICGQDTLGRRCLHRIDDRNISKVLHLLLHHDIVRVPCRCGVDVVLRRVAELRGCWVHGLCRLGHRALVRWWAWQLCKSFPSAFACEFGHLRRAAACALNPMFRTRPDRNGSGNCVRRHGRACWGEDRRTAGWPVRRRCGSGEVRCPQRGVYRTWDHHPVVWLVSEERVQLVQTIRLRLAVVLTVQEVWYHRF